MEERLTKNNNEKLTNRQLIQLLKNDLKHMQNRLDRIEWGQWGLMLAYVAGFVTIIVKVTFG